MGLLKLHGDKMSIWRNNGFNDKKECGREAITKQWVMWAWLGWDVRNRQWPEGLQTGKLINSFDLYFSSTDEFQALCVWMDEYVETIEYVWLPTVKDFV